MPRCSHNSAVELHLSSLLMSTTQRRMPGLLTHHTTPEQAFYCAPQTTTLNLSAASANRDVACGDRPSARAPRASSVSVDRPTQTQLFWIPRQMVPASRTTALIHMPSNPVPHAKREVGAGSCKPRARGGVNDSRSRANEPHFVLKSRRGVRFCKSAHNFHTHIPR
jgi:hypothetical protein